MQGLSHYRAGMPLFQYSTAPPHHQYSETSSARSDRSRRKKSTKKSHNGYGRLPGKVGVYRKLLSPPSNSLPAGTGLQMNEWWVMTIPKKLIDGIFFIYNFPKNVLFTSYELIDNSMVRNYNGSLS